MNKKNALYLFFLSFFCMSENASASVDISLIDDETNSSLFSQFFESDDRKSVVDPTAATTLVGFNWNIPDPGGPLACNVTVTWYTSNNCTTGQLGTATSIGLFNPANSPTPGSPSQFRKNWYLTSTGLLTYAPGVTTIVSVFISSTSGINACQQVEFSGGQYTRNPSTGSAGVDAFTIC